jgi:TonB family protein
MEIAERFKENLKRRTSESRDTRIAIYASLASHIGIFLILTTAAALSTEVKLWYPPVLHVDLVSVSTIKESRTLFDTGKMEKRGQENKNTIIEPAAVVSIDKKEKNNVQTQAATAPVVASRSVNIATPATVAMTKEASKEARKTNEIDIGRHTQLASNAPSSERISIAVPRYRDNSQPSYPRIASERGYEGLVLLSAEINADGKVGSLKVKKSSGFAMLDRSALDAVKKWKFEPGKKMGRPISMWVDVPVKFVLQNHASM